MAFTQVERPRAKFSYVHKPKAVLTLFNLIAHKFSKKKVVISLSSTHPDFEKTVCLPEIIKFYNKTKGAVDTFDQL